MIEMSSFQCSEPQISRRLKYKKLSCCRGTVRCAMLVTFASRSRPRPWHLVLRL